MSHYLQRLSTSADHSCFFRPLDDTQSNNLLLVHQTADQKRLMARYGNDTCLLDATYKTSKYALPLFFVVVLTNSGYQAVASFILSAETTDLIAEALQRLLFWNPGWKPRHWMTDKCDPEINAVESIFDGMYRCLVISLNQVSRVYYL